MTISKRTLLKWRKEALRNQEVKSDTMDMYAESAPNLSIAFTEANERILQLTQELIDQQLLKE